MQIIVLLLLSIVSAILYRAGGMSKDESANPKWIPKWLRQSWIRDWLCPMCALVVLLPNNMLCWLVAYGFMGAALSTYWDKLFGYDNYWFHGFMIGVACVPFAFANISLLLIGLRAVVLAVVMGVWSLLIGSDMWEEMGRGAVIPLSMWILLL